MQHQTYNPDELAELYNLTDEQVRTCIVVHHPRSFDVIPLDELRVGHLDGAMFTASAFDDQADIDEILEG